MRQISIVLPNYNGEKYLSQVIEAFLSQDYSNKRLFIVDGKSTDKSHAIIKSYCYYKEIIWIEEKDTGISNALNIASKYIDDSDIWGYLGSDDILLSDVFNKLNIIFNLHKVNGVYFDSYSFSLNTNKMKLRRAPVATFTESSLIKYGTIVGLQNIYFDAKLIKKNLFNEQAKFSMDYELYLRLIKKGYKSYIYFPLPSSINIQDGNISQIYYRKANAEALKFAFEIGGANFQLAFRIVRHNLVTFLHKINSFRLSKKA